LIDDIERNLGSAKPFAAYDFRIAGAGISRATATGCGRHQAGHLADLIHHGLRTPARIVPRTGFHATGSCAPIGLATVACTHYSGKCTGHAMAFRMI